MSGSTTHIATIKSNNLLYFKFPYNGGSRSSLTIRKKKNKLDIFYSISKGQIITNITGDHVKVKFDNDKPIVVKSDMPQDYSNDVIFLGSEKLLLKKLKSAKKFLIEVKFFQEGSKQIEFDIENLQFSH